MVLSRTSTAPTCLRSHVARVATTRAMFMKYSSQLTRVSIGPPGAIVPRGADAPLASGLTWRHAEDRRLARPLAARRRVRPRPGAGGAHDEPESPVALVRSPPDARGAPAGRD